LYAPTCVHAAARAVWGGAPGPAASVGRALTAGTQRPRL